MPDSPKHHAACSCGQLRADVSGEPVRVSICHCYACQRRTGSAFGYQARFPADRVKISGVSKEYIRHADEDGELRSFHFCPHCGATVWFTTGDAADLVAIPVGALADHDFGSPQVSVWEERRHAWVSVPEGAEHIQ